MFMIANLDFKKQYNKVTMKFINNQMNSDDQLEPYQANEIKNDIFNQCTVNDVRFSSRNNMLDVVAPNNAQIIEINKIINLTNKFF